MLLQANEFSCPLNLPAYPTTPAALHTDTLLPFLGYVNHVKEDLSSTVSTRLENDEDALAIIRMDRPDLLDPNPIDPPGFASDELAERRAQRTSAEMKAVQALPPEQKRQLAPAARSTKRGGKKEDDSNP